MVWRCFYCGRILAEISGIDNDNNSLIEVKCPKCKNNNILDLFTFPGKGS